MGVKGRGRVGDRRGEGGGVGGSCGVLQSCKAAGDFLQGLTFGFLEAVLVAQVEAAEAREGFSLKCRQGQVAAEGAQSALLIVMLLGCVQRRRGFGPESSCWDLIAVVLDSSQ